MKKAKPINPLSFLLPKYWLMWLFFLYLRLSILLPLRITEAHGAMLGMLLYRLSPSRRRVTRINIKQAYPNYSEQQIKNLSKTTFKSLGISVFEMALAWWASRNYLKKKCKLTGFEHIEKARAKNKPVILLTGHFTAIDLGGCLLAMYLPLQAVYKRAHNPMFNYFMHKYRNKHLAHAYPNTEVRRFMKELKNGAAIWYAPDQDFAQHDIVFTPFLGGMASTLTSTARMAQMTDAVVIPFYPKRIGKGNGYELVILPALQDFPIGDTETDASRVNQSIEKMVYQNPGQYAWFHKRFKYQPDGKPSIYQQ